MVRRTKPVKLVVCVPVRRCNVIFPNTITYLQSRAIADVAAEYRLTRVFSVFLIGRNVNAANEDTVTYGPSTPSDRIVRGRINYGANWYAGFKGSF